MKKLLVLFLVVSSTISFSQEKVLLRLNYAKGDTFVVKQDVSQDMGAQGGLDLKMSMEMKVNDVDGDSIKTESQIKIISMNMLQGGQIMSFDSTMKEEDLDQMGKMMKQQMDPMLKATIFSKITNQGEVVKVTVEPMTPAMDQFTKQNQSVKYPKEEVSVGSTWTDESSAQGMNTKMIFKVAKIENGKVYVDITGTVSGMGEGDVKGNLEIDIASGLQSLSNIEMSINAGGSEIKIKTNSTTSKI